MLCQRDVGKDEDKPLRLVIGWDSVLVAESVKFEADFGFNFKTIRPAFAEKPGTKVEKRVVAVFPEPTKAAAAPSYIVSPIASPTSQTPSPATPISFTALDTVPSLWTLHIILFGTILFLSWTSILYPRVYRCVCEHCPIQ